MPLGAFGISAFMLDLQNSLFMVLAAMIGIALQPMALRNMWTSMGRFRAHVEVLAGPPVPAAEASAERLEAQVRQLRGDAA